MGTVDRRLIGHLCEAQQGAMELLRCATEQAAAATCKEGVPAK